MKKVFKYLVLALVAFVFIGTFVFLYKKSRPEVITWQELPVSVMDLARTSVVTGKVEPYSRTGINAKIEALGARAGSSVSSKTDYLICGENAGSKLEKAQSLGITVLTPAEFFRMIGE